MGFEPMDHCWPPGFKAGALGHSATFPKLFELAEGVGIEPTGTGFKALRHAMRQALITLKIGAGCRSRTDDLMLTRQLLSRLS